MKHVKSYENMNSSLVTTAKEYGTKCHIETNHTYDGKPYSFHLEMVYNYAQKYSYLLKGNEVDFVLAGCWVHDTIEDARQTYNDVKTVCGVQVAEIAYALTNEKGRNRKERANDKYYEGIRNNPYATFVKICDRLANTKHSKNSGSGMINAYRKEMEHFKSKLYTERFAPMFDELEELIS